MGQWRVISAFRGTTACTLSGGVARQGSAGAKRKRLWLAVVGNVLMRGGLASQGSGVAVSCSWSTDILGPWCGDKVVIAGYGLW